MRAIADKNLKLIAMLKYIEIMMRGKKTLMKQKINKAKKKNQKYNLKNFHNNNNLILNRIFNLA